MMSYIWLWDFQHRLQILEEKNFLTFYSFVILETLLSALGKWKKKKKISDIIYKKLLINFTKAVQCCVLVVNLGDSIREFLSIYAF